ncbi:MAG: nuclear transport factor 2 family protein [Actinobacteria bacterium]|nr:nuclear transport factor 2 family protein [Actinomycetota bacterium]
MDAADKLDLMELLTRMYKCVDGHDGPGLAALFAADGELVHPAATVRRDGLEEFLHGWVSEGMEDNALHIPSNPVFDDVDTPEPKLTMVSTKYRMTSPPQLWVTAEITLTGRQEGGAWKIGRLEARGLSELPEWIGKDE